MKSLHVRGGIFARDFSRRMRFCEKDILRERDFARRTFFEKGIFRERDFERRIRLIDSPNP